MEFIAVLIIAIVVIVVLLFVVARQGSQIKDLSEVKAASPKYGFLGKPLASFVIVGLMIGGIGLTYFATQNTQNVTVKADVNVELEIMANTGSITGSGTPTFFSVTPKLDGVDWGSSPDNKFDAFWTIIGPVDASAIELELTSENTGGFTRTLQSGTYSVEVEVVFRDKIYKETKTLSVR